MAPADRVDLVIEAQRRQFPELDFSAKAVAGRLVRLGALFVQAMERIATPSGLSANEYVILCVLRANGAPYTLPPKSITPLMDLTSGGKTNILHALERRGLVERLPDPSDRRGVLIRLTAPAVRLIDLAIAEHVAEERRMIAALTPKERVALKNLLSKLLVALDPVALRMAARQVIRPVRGRPVVPNKRAATAKRVVSR
jgi:DNA-binding MarR family transcriptional regulator